MRQGRTRAPAGHSGLRVIPELGCDGDHTLGSVNLAALLPACYHSSADGGSRTGVRPSVRTAQGVRLGPLDVDSFHFIRRI